MSEAEIEAEVAEGLQFLASAPKLMQILNEVAAVYGAGKMDIMSFHRFPHLVSARDAYYWLARQLTARSYPEIGRFLGNRDHSTVLTGVSRMNRRMSKNRDKLALVIERLGRDPSEVLP